MKRAELRRLQYTYTTGVFELSWESMRLSYLLLLVAFLAGCSSLPRYEEPPAATSGVAIIKGQGSMLSLCGLTDNSICKAGVMRVDGHNAGGSTSLRIAAGVREIVLLCTAKTGISVRDMIWFTRQVQADIAPGGSYQIKAHWTGAECVMDLLDAATGQAVVQATEGPR